ncbi:glycosyltransferase [Pseudoalteromonas sp. S2893]|uniref:glycosyltransferase n=1 Tax=Pseudoalteromonas sp. S2893 TaxID=579530 RepID=UPI00110AFF7F|nr:glycosyltransferase [Pseudoalteromonas sp. S2893]TMP13889.1 hypothetical protein CWC04_17935 [Pseudoalteromonas sp. S2893]
MNYIFYSVTGDYNSFHRRREIEALVTKSAGKALYFNNPKFILKVIYNKFKNKGKNKVGEKAKGNIKVGDLITLLPVSLALKSKFLMLVCVTLPIKLQVYFAKKYFFNGEKYINWFYKPEQYTYLKNNGEYIYLHYDNYKEDRNYKFSSNKNFDVILKLCVEASLITLVSSSKLYERYKSFDNEFIYYYPNAISRELVYSGVLKMNEQPQKKIGFIGQLDSTFDYDLIKKVALHYTTYSIFLIGPDKNKEAVNELKDIKNISLLGFLSYEQLAEQLVNFDLGICPYKESEFNQYRNPLKIMEYFSYGLPVVTVSCDISKDISNLISVVDDHTHFIKAIENELSSDTLEKRYARQSIAKINCWDNRAEFILNKLSLLN